MENYILARWAWVFGYAATFGVLVIISARAKKLTLKALIITAIVGALLVLAGLLLGIAGHESVTEILFLSANFGITGHADTPMHFGRLIVWGYALAIDGVLGFLVLSGCES